jgi:dihydropteroate synthase
MARESISVVGILNCTPDSFSDGVPEMNLGAFSERAQQLIDDGADMLDIGGDSTRPGSECCGSEEEWRRVGPILQAWAHRIPCSVDTHSVEVARRAVEAGVSCINDVSGVADPKMLALVAEAKVRYIAMYNPHGGAHLFGQGALLHGVIDSINGWISQVDQAFRAVGGESSNLICDSGMGAFLSQDSEVSWHVIRHYDSIQWPKGGAFFGCSRKGFLHKSGESLLHERDVATAECGVLVATKISSRTPLYLRVHNPRLQRAAIEQWRSEG